MSIYVKNAKMPECCAECPFETLFSNDIHYCTAEEIPTEIPTAYYWECRPLFCPMSEVAKPHGDLVDHSEVGKVLISALDECDISSSDKEYIIKTMWIIPTIIEGSEK